ncbi:MAG: hypothetical protein KC502_22775, partial [Myxococcales bacterium]|nr:hypothetical protein [Myxococcales bacterium]
MSTPRCPGAKTGTPTRALAADVARYLDGRRVRAHAYSPQEHLRRIVRAWRAPLIVAAVAVVLLVIVAGVQYRRTSLERDRAVTAEQSASKARRSSDESLASSLSQHALAAMALGQRDLAETFAIEALVRAESPDARGVLAAFAHAPAATHLPSLPLPRCRKARVVGDYLVCLAGHRASLWQWSDGAYHRRWQRRLDNVRDAAVFERAGKVVLLSERQFVADLASGALQRAGGLAIAPVKVETSSIGSEALASDALVALMLTPDGADATVPLRCPHGGVFGAATKSTGRRAALICGRAGELVVATLPHAIERTIPTSVSVHHGATAAVWLPGAVTLLVGTRDGTLLQVDTNTGDELELGRLPGGQIDRLLLGPNGERVAIETARGPVMIWHSAGRTVLTRIPSTRPLALAWRNSGTELWMYGDRLERWRLPAAAKAIRMWSRNGRPGLGNAVLSPNGRTVALAPGSGQLQLLDAASGARIYSHQ